MNINYNDPTRIFRSIFAKNVQISCRKTYFTIFARELFKVKMQNCKQYQKYTIFGSKYVSQLIRLASEYTNTRIEDTFLLQNYCNKAIII